MIMRFNRSITPKCVCNCETTLLYLLIDQSIIRLEEIDWFFDYFNVIDNYSLVTIKNYLKYDYTVINNVRSRLTEWSFDLYIGIRFLLIYLWSPVDFLQGVTVQCPLSKVSIWGSSHVFLIAMYFTYLR